MSHLLCREKRLWIEKDPDADGASHVRRKTMTMNGKLLVGDWFGAIYFYNPFREKPLNLFLALKAASTTLDGASHISNDVF